MNILLFGGSFNPPHLGHLLVIEQVAELLTNINELWLLPTYNHTFGKELIDPSHRLAMCRLLIDEVQSSLPIKLCPIEIDYHTSGSTYDTLQLLKTENKYLDNVMTPRAAPLSAHTYSFLMGSDQLPSFNKWHHWQELLETMPFYVYPRGGHRHDVTYPHMTALESPHQIVTNISSTLVRERFLHQLPINHILPPSIFNYITTHHLYLPTYNKIP